ncbi:phenylacetate--CoA ligase family protein [Gehongia tenuis]|uniref:Phenylacetate-coenzyme A ligase n=1 Tax=Gehongia tenuis TaxID=2763655 RepID=A0A926D3F2_9FIRM|nr:phenylacetate--CoA ligase [Gehongia tenuis]MBC8530593.1 phenylacetate--CoA ligase [Gehongia tenuis]
MYQPELETMSRSEREALQGERLRAMVKRVYEKVPYYRAKMDAAKVAPSDIRGIRDITKLPFVTKQDLRDTYPFGMFAVPKKEVVRIHASSGTTGKQTVVGYTRDDLALWGTVMARTLSAAGANEDSTVQVAYGYGLFTGGLGAHIGAETLGAAVIPASSGNTKRQIRMMADFGTTHLCCTPSYAIYIGETMKEMGMVPGKDIHMVGGCFGAEPWTPAMRRRLEALLGLRAHDIYGLSEIIGPGVSFECECQDGLHVNEDFFYPEIINPETGEPVPEGEMGELVITTFTKEALPLVRYRTRDITSLTYGKCACGRTLVKMGKPAGRSDDMLIIRGVNVFPSQVESVLMEMGATAPYYMLVVDRKHDLDTLEIQIEVDDELFSDEVRRLEQLEGEIQQKVESVLGLSAKIHLVGPKTLPRSEGKAQRVIDKRQL